MPLSLAAATLIGQGINALTGFGNRETQKRQNAKDRDFQIQMYNLQRRHALEDWSKEADYNSPLQQMERLRQAGLNPNLVYGKGADNTMRSVRSSQANAPNQTAPQFNYDASNALLQYANVQRLQADTDLLKKNQALRDQEILLKQAQTATELERAGLTGEQWTQLSAMRQDIIDEQRLKNEKTEADISYTLSENERRDLMNTANVNLTLEKILSERKNRAKTDAEIRKIDAMINEIKANTDLKNYDLEIRSKGIYPNDPLWMRMIAQFIGQDPKTLESALLVNPGVKSTSTTSKQAAKSSKRRFTPTTKF